MGAVITCFAAEFREDHLLLLLTVAFAETIPLLSDSMSSRSSIVLPSLDWLLSKELSLHALS